MSNAWKDNILVFLGGTTLLAGCVIFGWAGGQLAKEDEKKKERER